MFIKFKTILLALVLVCLSTAEDAKALPIPLATFNSSGYVDKNFGPWDASSFTGTALYTFNIETPGVDVYAVQIEFEPDIFNLNLIEPDNFEVFFAKNLGISKVLSNYT